MQWQVIQPKCFHSQTPNDPFHFASLFLLISLKNTTIFPVSSLLLFPYLFLITATNFNRSYSTYASTEPPPSTSTCCLFNLTFENPSQPRAHVWHVKQVQITPIRAEGGYHRHARLHRTFAKHLLSFCKPS